MLCLGGTSGDDRVPMTGSHGRNITEEFLADRAKFVRLETVRLSRIAGAGHYSSTFSAAELFAALFYAHLRIDPAEPKWPDRDRFVLSKGHAAIGLYPVLADLGFFPPSALDNYTRLGSPFGDHPDMKKIAGHRLQLRLARPRPLDRRSAWRWPAACRTATTASIACSATASCTRARSGKPRWPPRTTGCRASSASSTATGCASTARPRR